MTLPKLTLDGVTWSATVDAVGVAVGVIVPVAVKVGEGVAVIVEVGVGSGVGLGVPVEVGVAVELTLEVGVGVAEELLSNATAASPGIVKLTACPFTEDPPLKLPIDKLLEFSLLSVMPVVYFTD